MGLTVGEETEEKFDEGGEDEFPRDGFATLRRWG